MIFIFILFILYIYLVVWVGPSGPLYAFGEGYGPKRPLDPPVKPVPQSFFSDPLLVILSPPFADRYKPVIGGGGGAYLLKALEMAFGVLQSLKSAVPELRSEHSSSGAVLASGWTNN